MTKQYNCLHCDNHLSNFHDWMLNIVNIGWIPTKISFDIYQDYLGLEYVQYITTFINIT